MWQSFSAFSCLLQNKANDEKPFKAKKDKVRHSKKKRLEITIMSLGKSLNIGAVINMFDHCRIATNLQVVTKFGFTNPRLRLYSTISI